MLNIHSLKKSYYCCYVQKRNGIEPNGNNIVTPNFLKHFSKNQLI